MPHHIHLTPDQDQQLLALKNDLTVPKRTRERAEALRLSMHGLSVPQIACYLDWAESTVRSTFRRWWDRGIEGLTEAPGRGTQQTWHEEDLLFVEQCLQQQPRSFNAMQLSRLLEHERGVRLGPDHLRKLLKKRASVGKESEPV